jgi:hypothetical protein
MGGTCSIHLEHKICGQDFRWKTSKGESAWEWEGDVNVDLTTMNVCWT